MENQIQRIEQLEVEVQEAEARTREQQSQLQEAHRDAEEFRGMNNSLQRQLEQLQNDKAAKDFQNEVNQ